MYFLCICLTCRVASSGLRYFGAKGAPDHIIHRIAKKLSQDNVFNLRPIKNMVTRNLVPQLDRIEQRATMAVST